jgi:hypothetical protein
MPPNRAAQATTARPIDSHRGGRGTRGMTSPRYRPPARRTVHDSW